MRRRLYSISLLLFLGLILSAVAAFNVIIDPYGIYNIVVRDGLNKRKVAKSVNWRLVAPVQMRHMRPELLIIGSSHANSLDCDHPGWNPDHKACFYASAPLIDACESSRFFQFAESVHPLKRVVIDLDMFAFNDVSPSDPGDEEYRLSLRKSVLSPYVPIQDIFLTTISRYAIEDSIQTISGQNDLEAPIMLSNGRVTPESAYDVRQGYRKPVQGQLLGILGSYMPFPTKTFVLWDKGEKNSQQFDCLKNIITISRKNKIDLRLFINPDLAWTEEAKKDTGLWSDYEQWKRELLKISAPHRAGEKPIPLWDFSGYNSITTDDVPPEGSMKPMKYYWDSHHYKEIVGEMIFDRIYGYSAINRPIPSDFGVLLTPENIDQHLLDIRRNQKAYFHSHPVDVGYIEKLVRPRSR
jgi:hypothetical protein